MSWNQLLIAPNSNNSVGLSFRNFVREIEAILLQFFANDLTTIPLCGKKIRAKRVCVVLIRKI